MKWLSTACLALSAATQVIGGPLPQSEPDSYGPPPPSDITLYHLKLSNLIDSPDFPELHNKYLKSHDEAIGILNQGSQLKVFTQDGPEEGQVSIHVWPIGIVDHALALIGRDGLYDFKHTIPSLIDPFPGTVHSWREFNFDEKTSTVSWNNSESAWVVFPRENDEWVTFWRDRSAITTQNFLPVDIVYEVVE